MTYNAPFTFPATKGIFLSFSPLSKATWHSRGDFWGRRELVSALHRNCLREIKDCIKNKNTLVVFGVCGVCVFFSSVVTVADKWRFVSSSFCSCEKVSAHIWRSQRCILWKMYCDRELCYKVNTALTWSAFSCTSRRSHCSFSSFSSKIANFVWKAN